jgi:hypothetical protein
VAKGQGGDGEGEGRPLFRKLSDPGRVGEFGQGDGEGGVDEGPQDIAASCGTAEEKSLPELELRQNVDPRDMIDVEVTQKKNDRFGVVHAALSPVDAVAGVREDVVTLRPDQRANRVSRRRVVSAVGDQ